MKAEGSLVGMGKVGPVSTPEGGLGGAGQGVDWGRVGGPEAKLSRCWLGVRRARLDNSAQRLPCAGLVGTRYRGQGKRERKKTKTGGGLRSISVGTAKYQRVLCQTH